MKITPNYGLKMPEGSDTVNVDDFNGNSAIIDSKLKELETNETFYVVATGSANTYTISISALSPLNNYYDGLSVCAKINVDCTGASTLNINGWGSKPIIDSSGNQITSGGLKANTPYPFRYENTRQAFILVLKGGGGNVTADKLLTGYTATGDTGQVAGTMPNNGSINITPSTTAQQIPPGYTSGGAVAGDLNLISANILSGKAIFGVSGKPSVVDTADGTATASQILTGSGAYVNGSKVNGSMVNNGSIVITPGATAQPIPQGYHNGQGTVATDINLINGNIKAGVTIFGVSGKSSVVDTSDGTATAGQILTGSTGYVNGSKVTGTMTNNGAVTITPGATAKTIPAGYHNGSGTVATDSNLVTGNIKAGVTIFGVSGKSSVVETSLATATAGQILNGKTAFVNGSLITGSMTNITADQNNSGIATSGTTIGLKVPAGYYDGTHNVNATSTSIDGNLSSGNIRNGVTIMGIAGNVTIESLGGRQYASGSGLYSGTLGTFYTVYNNNSTSMYYLKVSGLSFKPTGIIIKSQYGTSGYVITYEEVNTGTYAKTVTYASFITNGVTVSGAQYRGDTGSAYVNSGGFLLPVAGGSGFTWNWEAWE